MDTVQFLVNNDIFRSNNYTNTIFSSYLISFSYFRLNFFSKVVWQEQVEKAPFERRCRYGLSNVSLIISYSIFYSESSLPYKNSNWIYLMKTEYSSIINILYVSYLNKSYISVYLFSFLFVTKFSLNMINVVIFVSFNTWYSLSVFCHNWKRKESKTYNIEIR